MFDRRCKTEWDGYSPNNGLIFSNPFIPLLMTTGSWLKCATVVLKGRLAHALPKCPTTALPNTPCRLCVNALRI